MISDIDDKELLDRFYESYDNKWLGILLPRYTLLLFGVCMKYLKNEEDAKDAVQQVFLKAISELHKYRVDYFKSWLYMIAKNHCLTKLRKIPHSPIELNEKIMATPDEYFRLDTYIEQDAGLSNMHLAMQQLSAEQKDCLTLFYLEKRSYAEVAAQTGFSLLQVKSYIQNGKRNLRLLLKSDILKYGTRND